MKHKDALAQALALYPFAPAQATAIDVTEQGVSWACCESPLHNPRLPDKENALNKRMGWAEECAERGGGFTFLMTYLSQKAKESNDNPRRR